MYLMLLYNMEKIQKALFFVILSAGEFISE